MTTRALEDGYELDDDPARIDVDAATAYLGGESYWARGRSRDVMERLVRDATRTHHGAPAHAEHRHVGLTGRRARMLMRRERVDPQL